MCGSKEYWRQKSDWWRPPEQQILGEWKTVSAPLETLHPVKRPTIDQIIQCWTSSEVLTNGICGLVFYCIVFYLKIKIYKFWPSFPHTLHISKYFSEALIFHFEKYRVECTKSKQGVSPILNWHRGRLQKVGICKSVAIKCGHWQRIYRNHWLLEICPKVVRWCFKRLLTFQVRQFVPPPPTPHPILGSAYMRNVHT